ncbi:MAG TPA: ATP-binding protein, partial [Polyangiaceae bacterium]
MMQDLPETGGRGKAEPPLVGRDEEVSGLRRTAQSVRDDGQARVVTLVGPNGVGKTSIIDAALRELAADPSRNLRVYRGSARGSSAVHAALGSLLRSRFGLSPSATPDEVRAVVHDQVSKVLDDRKVGDVCFFLGQILDVPFPDSPLTKALGDDPTQGRMLRRAIIKSFFESDASRGALCLVFDDLDAAGEDSIGLVSYLVEHVTGPVLIVCSMRPEMPVRYANWFTLGGARHSRVDVGPLPPET